MRALGKQRLSLGLGQLPKNNSKRASHQALEAEVEAVAAEPSRPPKVAEAQRKKLLVGL